MAKDLFFNYFLIKDELCIPNPLQMESGTAARLRGVVPAPWVLDAVELSCSHLSLPCRCPSAEQQELLAKGWLLPAMGGRTGEEGVKPIPAAGCWHGSRGCKRQHKSMLLARVALATAHPHGGSGSGILQEMMQLQLSRIVFTLSELILSREGGEGDGCALGVGQ